MSDETITVGELLTRIHEAQGKMSLKNPNRLLLQQCAQAIGYLSQAAPEEPVRTKGGIILP